MYKRNTLLYKNISLTLYSRKDWCFCGVWEMGGETYTQREDFFFFPYLLQGARGCQHLHPLSSSSETPLIGCVSLSRLPKSDRVIITWSSSGYTLVQPECPDALSSSCLLIKMWKLAKAHGVTRNELKIHSICYITYLLTYIYLLDLALDNLQMLMCH